MTNKIILTVEQDEAINKLKRVSREDLLKVHAKGNKWICISNECLNELTVDQMARILYEPNSYEVEQPKFEVGDWVVGNSGTIHKLIKDAGNDFFTETLEGKEGYASPNYIRPATEEEKFWFELGRKIGEFKDGDVVQTKNMVRPYKLKSKQDLLDAKNDYHANQLKSFYPTESFKPFPTGNK